MVFFCSREAYLVAILRKTNKQRYTTFLHSISLDENLSLKDFGLLIKLLSLPDDWKFSEKGLEKILKKDGQTSIRTAVKNLETYGYLKRERIRNDDGTMGDVIWYIYEEPQIDNSPKEPDFENHNLDDFGGENPDFENQSLENSSLETHKQYNIKEPNIKKSNTKIQESKNEDETKNKISFNKIIEDFCAGNLELEEKLKSFVQMRFRIKKELTNSGLRELINELLKISKGNQTAMIEIVKKSIRNSWTDFYELKNHETPCESSYNLDDYEYNDIFEGFLKHNSLSYSEENVV